MINATIKEVNENKIKQISDSPLSKLAENKVLEKSIEEYDKPLAIIYDNIRYCPIDGNNGRWDGERGNSDWTPEIEFIPRKSNPESKPWKEICDKYGIEEIPFKNGEPNFSDISKGEVEIDLFSDSRTDNFDKADIEIANQKGRTPEEVAKWRKENGYTWHECKDMKTMQKVPGIVHNNITHSGGISEVKKGIGDNI